jgi:Fe-S-cluster containining protein
VEDEFRVFVDGEDTGVVLGGAALAVVFQFDGARSFGRIVADLLEDGVPVPGEDFVRALAEGLGQVGLVRVLDDPLVRPYRREIPSELISLHPLRHECVGCGRSCQGHLLGPLDDAYLARADRVHAQMVEIYPELEGINPVWEVEDDSVKAFRKALTTREDGTCIYLDDDRLCRVHKHLGADQKPIICRLFPLTIVQAEDGVRVGTPLRCYTHHRSWASGPEVTAVQLTGIPADEMPTFTARGMDSSSRGRVVLNPEPAGDYAKMLRAEESIIAILQRPDATVSILLAMLFEMSEGAPLMRPLDGIVEESQFGPETVGRLRRFSQGMRKATGALLDDPGPSTHTFEIAALLAFIDGLEARPFHGLTAGERAFSMHTLSEWIFLREWVHQPSLLVGVLLLLVGIILAHWRAEDEGGDHSEGEVSDAFGFSLACWCRLMRIGKNIVLVVEDEADFHRFVQTLSPQG